MNASNENKKKNASAIAAQAGFTLVEIAIVLVIIGLLLGGILKGQEMITQAKIKNVINDFNGVTAAVTSYQDRYRAIPGDDQSATTRWTTQAPVSGDGNGIVIGVYNANNTAGAGGAPINTAESNLFWQHLRIAGFIAGPTTALGSGSPPPNATGGIIGVETGGGCPGCGAGLGFTSLIMCTSNLPDKVAIAVDTQADDGSPTGGQVRGQLQTTPSPPTQASAGIPAYVETGTNQYLLCKNL
jgi:prepilin-type N-terminal cleavage/methylation domain-containing protein